MNNSIICLKDICKTYKSKKVIIPALKNINMTIEKGEMVAIVGQSGSGKSTLLSIIGLLDECDSGKYLLNNSETGNFNSIQKAKARNATLGFVVQDFALIETYTVFQNVYVPLLYSQTKLRKKDCVEKIDKILDSLGIITKKNSLAHDLSGGQRQRVAIARAMVNNPDIIIADEPTGELDTETAFNIMKILEELISKGKTVIIATHNPEIASRCSKIFTIKDGKII